MATLPDMAEERPASERPALGGRRVEGGVNAGILRCPRCFARLVSRCAVLTQREGDDAILCVPRGQRAAPGDDAVGGSAGGGAPEEANALATVAPPAVEGDAPAEAERPLEWTEQVHEWWWMVEDVNDMDSTGLSRLISTPRGEFELVICCGCSFGPFGYRDEPSPRLWLCCDLLHQQELSEADDTADFAPPAGIDLSQLQAMIASGMATTQVKLTFDEQRLGMMLADAADGSRTVVRRDAARGGWGRPEVVGAWASDRAEPPIRPRRWCTPSPRWTTAARGRPSAAAR